MKTRLLLPLLGLIMSASFLHAEATWSDNLDSSLAKAKADKKLVLVDFTGSDWCGWCIKLDKEVFSTPEFAAYAASNLELVKIDFPRRSKLDPKVAAQNEALAKKYDIEGFPTILVFNSAGKEVGRLGYMEGGPSAFIAELKKLKP